MLLACSNGGAVPDGGRNWPLRGCKWTSWEGGVRQTAVWSGGALPSASIGQRYSGIGHVADLYATLATVAGVSAAELAASSARGPAPLDSVSLWEVLRNPRSPSPRTEVLIYGQNWSPDPSIMSSSVASAPVCKSSVEPSGQAYHNPRSMRQFPAPNRSAAAADECAAACCAESNCTGWMLTTPRLLRPPCAADRPCCWLVEGGTLSQSADPLACLLGSISLCISSLTLHSFDAETILRWSRYSGSSGRPCSFSLCCLCLCLSAASVSVFVSVSHLLARAASPTQARSERSRWSAAVWEVQADSRGQQVRRLVCSSGRRQRDRSQSSEDLLQPRQRCGFPAARRSKLSTAWLSV